MMNYKVRVANEAESKEVQGWFFELGYCWYWNKKKNIEHLTGVINASSDMTLTSGNFSNDGFQELTIPQLRDKVVLHRNDVSDANYIRVRDGKKYFKSSENRLYHMLDDEWILSTWMNEQLEPQLKPIEKEMKQKEYLNPLKDGGYELIIPTIIGCADRDWIEVPEGAELACDWCNDCDFYKQKDGKLLSFEHGQWGECEFDMTYLLNNVRNILWQRNPPVEAEVKTEEPPVISDSIEETLKERQSTYGDFKFVANTTGQLMAVALNSANGKTLPYMHEEALHMIFSKIARLVNGDYNHIDSWHDIAGYATLVENELKKNQK